MGYLNLYGSDPANDGCLTSGSGSIHRYGMGVWDDLGNITTKSRVIISREPPLRCCTDFSKGQFGADRPKSMDWMDSMKNLPATYGLFVRYTAIYTE